MKNSFQSSYERKEENKKKERKVELRQNVMERKQEVQFSSVRTKKSKVGETTERGSGVRRPPRGASLPVGLWSPGWR